MDLKFELMNTNQTSISYNILFARVDAIGDLICDYEKLGTSQQAFQKLFGINSTNFYDKDYITSQYNFNGNKIQIKPLFPDTPFPSKLQMLESNSALIIFEYGDPVDCPKLLISFHYQSFIGKQEQLAEKLKQYKVCKEIARGKQCDFHEVIEQSSGKKYVRKTAHLQLLQKYQSFEETRKKILISTLKQQQIESQNLISIKECFDSDENLYIIMEQANSNLDDCILARQQNNDPFSISDVKNIMVQVCNSIMFARKNNFLNKSFKTSDFIQCCDGSIKISKLGYEMELIGGKSSFSILYNMAPELIEDFDNYSEAADVFSIGCILYLLMTFQNAFILRDDDKKSNIYKQIESGVYPNDLISYCYLMIHVQAAMRPKIDNVKLFFQKYVISQRAKIQWQINKVDKFKKCCIKVNEINQFQKLFKGVLNSISKVNNQKIKLKDFEDIADLVVQNQIFMRYLSLNLSDQQQCEAIVKIIIARIIKLRLNYSSEQQDHILQCGEISNSNEVDTNETQYRKCIYADGMIIIGLFCGIEPNGFCRQIIPYKQIYIGEFKQGLRSGIGTEINANGEMYIGEWENNLRNGNGEIKLATEEMMKQFNKSEFGLDIQKVINNDQYKMMTDEQ